MFHNVRPDYSRPVFTPGHDVHEKLLNRLSSIYGTRKASKALKELERIMSVYSAHKICSTEEAGDASDQKQRFTEKDAVLITYGDLIRDDGNEPLSALAELCEEHLKDAFNTLHILPFFPYSSDRGFAVVDFLSVDPNLGTWDNILALKKHFKLMFDGVFNHVSSMSRWFQEFLNQNPEYRNFFISYSAGNRISKKKISMLFRPRTSDVFTSFLTLKGERKVWTTFGPDQVDLNFKNPAVLIKIVDILLYYVLRGADIVRLDAVTYLWKELGTDGVHHVNTHQIIKLLRDILNAVAPHVSLITETNVPHDFNISYFGDGNDEAQMVYNFALPPLLLHTFFTGDSSRLSGWARSLNDIPGNGAFFNFLDSHDGIGLMGAKGILSEEEIDSVVRNTIKNGGLVSYKKEMDGGETPYELNITSFSALGRSDAGVDDNYGIRRYMAARAIQLVLAGVPGIYLHGLIGSENDISSVQGTAGNRDINRKNLSKLELFDALNDENSTTAKVAGGISELLKVRQSEAAFNPYSAQEVIDAGNSFFCVVRSGADDSEVIAVINVTDKDSELNLRLDGRTGEYRDLLSCGKYRFYDGSLSAQVMPYGALWLKKV